MPGYPLRIFKYFALDNAGRPLSNGTLETFEAGTNNHLDTYADAALTVVNPNPVPLNEHGRAWIFVEAGVPYDVVLRSSTGAIIDSGQSIELPEVAAAPAPAGAVPPGVIAAY